ncbi:MAG: hypothetical protein EBU85_05135, partial [Actinobacteria bacterium]|nr:hypothetical protein [Actinomycetota bacterium]
MTVAEYLAALRRGWVTVLIAIFVGSVAAAGISLAQTPVYAANCRLFVAMGGVDTSGQNVLQGAQFAAQRVKSYTQVVASPNVLEPVIRQLKLNTTVTDLAKQVSATNPLDTVLIDVSAKDPNPIQAANLANLTCGNLGSEIERIELVKAGLTQASAVSVSVITPAVVPQFPVSPRKKLNVALGFLLGLAIGSGLVILRETLDTTIKDSQTVEDIMESAPIGTVPFDPERKAVPLAALSARSTASEAFRSLRTNLRYVDVDNPPKVFVVTSSIPGEGKSTTSANLAITFAVNGAKVAVLEGDLRMPRLASYLGNDSSVGLTDVLAGERALEDVLVPFRDGLFDLMPAGKVPPNPSELLGS